MARWADAVLFLPVSTGTGNFVVSTAVQGYMTPAQSGMVDGQIYRYRAESADLSQWEIGYGVYTAGTTTLARTIIMYNSSGGTSAINFSTIPQVGIVNIAADLGIMPPQGRLTLASGIAVMASTVSGANTVYYTPSNGNMIPVPDGSGFIMVAFAQVSQLTTDTTKSPAACAANSNYDMFGWMDGTTFRVTRGPAWSSNTARGTGAGTTELDFTTAFVTNKVAITNGPAAGRGIYLGSIRTNASSLVDYILGGSANGGVAASLCVWNMYNRNYTLGQSIDSTSYTYNSNTVRQAHASAGNQVGALFGLIVDTFDVTYTMRVDTAAVAGAFGQIGISEDLAVGGPGVRVFCRTVAALANIVSPYASWIKIPQLGYHFWSGTEGCDATPNTITFNSDANAQLSLKVWN